MEVFTIELPAMYGDHHVVEVRRILLDITGVEAVYASRGFRAAEISPVILGNCQSQRKSPQNRPPPVTAVKVSSATRRHMKPPIRLSVLDKPLTMKVVPCGLVRV